MQPCGKQNFKGMPQDGALVQDAGVISKPGEDLLCGTGVDLLQAEAQSANVEGIA